MRQAVITDCEFETPDIERAILEPLGCQVTIGKCRTPDELKALVAEPEFIMNVWAPLTAPVIAAMKNVVISAHIASVSPDAGPRARASVANTVACAVRGEKLPNVMNGVGLRAHSAKSE